MKYVKRRSPGLRAKLLGFSQWVGSEKLRKNSEWEDKTVLFSDGFKKYRIAYEAAFERRDEGLARVMKKVAHRIVSQKLLFNSLIRSDEWKEVLRMTSEAA